MGFMKGWNVTLSRWMGVHVDDNGAMSVNPGALSSASDNIAIHHTRGAVVIPTHTGGTPMTALTANKTSDEITVPAWASGIVWNVTHAADAGNSGSCTVSIGGACATGQTCTLHSDSGTSAMITHTVGTTASGETRVTRGLPGFIKIITGGTWSTAGGISVSYQFITT